MGVIAGQLVERIAIEGDDSARSKLSAVSKAADQAHQVMSTKLASAAKSAGSSFLDFASKAGMAVMGFKGLIDAAIGVGKSLLSPVFDAEQLGISFTTLMGSAGGAAKEIAKLNKFADITPFEPGPVQQYDAQLIGLGIDARDTVPIMTSLGDALFGIGHGTEAEMGSVVDQIGKIRVAGVMTWGDISQLQTHGINVLNAMSRATGKSEEELRNMSSSGINASYAIDALTRGIEMNPLYQGGMAKQANSAAGIMSTLSGYVTTALNSFLGLKDGMVVTGGIFDKFKTILGNVATAVQSPAFQQFATVMGERVSGALQTVSDFVSSRIIPAFTSFKDVMSAFQPSIEYWEPKFQAIGDSIEKSAVAVFHWVDSGQALKDVMEGLKPAVNFLTPKFQKLGDAFAHLRDVIKPVLDRLGQSFAQFSKKVAESGIPLQLLRGIFTGIVLYIGLLAMELTFLVNAISSVVTFFTTAGSNAKWLWNIFASIGSFLSSVFSPLWDKLAGVFRDQIAPAFGQLMPLLERFVPTGERLAQVGQSIWVNFQAMAAILTVVAGVVVGVIGGVIAHIAVFIGGIAQAIGGVIQIISGFIQVAVGIINFFVDLFTGKLGNLGADLGVIWQGIVTMFTGGWNLISGLFIAFIGSIVSYIWGFITSIIGFFTHLWDMLVHHSIIPDMINEIVDWFKNLPKWIFDNISGMAKGMGDIFANVGAAMWNGIRQGINWIIDGINRLIGFLNNMTISIPKVNIPGVGDVGGQTFGLPHINPIPRLRTGGIIAEGGFADVHKDERLWLPQGARVYPASQASQMAQQPQIIVNLPDIILDGQRLTRAQMPYITNGIRLHTGAKI